MQLYHQNPHPDTDDNSGNLHPQYDLQALQAVKSPTRDSLSLL